MNKDLLKNISRKIIFSMPYAKPLYSICNCYINRAKGENNADLCTNGELFWWRQVVPHCETVFDVGANIGDFTDAVMQINSKLDIHLFEPSISTYAELEKRKWSNRVYLNRCGLSSENKETVLHIFEETLGVNSLYPREGLNKNPTSEEVVNLITLDSYCEEQQIKIIDLLKIDVEGHELAVLQGATNMLQSERIKMIQFEYGGTYIDSRVLLKDMFVLLQSYGYSLGKLLPDRIEFVSEYTQDHENFQYQNWVAISPSHMQLGH